MQRTLFTLCGAAACCLAWSLYSERGSDTRADLASAEVNYPKGPWWRADVSDVALASAHILIRFVGVATADTDLHVPNEPVTRSEPEARELAQRLARELEADPTRFEELARRYSDDLTTRERGGRLGTVFVPSLPTPITDALGTLAIGETSRPVRTKLGYHVLKRAAVPPVTRLSGSEIVIAYEGVSAAVGQGRSATRTREDALRLGLEVAREAKQHPERFAELAARHSDAPDAVQGGDFGERWSYDSWDFFVLDTLQDLHVGEVYGPFDDAVWGVRIVQRTAPPRETFAATSFVVGHALEPRPAWSDPAVTRGTESARAIAEGLVEQLATTPAAFDEVRRKHCDYGLCRAPTEPAHAAGTSPWVGLDGEIAKVAVGEVIRAPVWTPLGFVIARREDPAHHPAPPFTPRLELPTPPRVGLASATEEQLIGYIDIFKAEALRRVDFDAAERASFERIVQELTLGLKGADAARRAAEVADAQARAKAALGEARMAELLALEDAVNLAVQGE